MSMCVQRRPIISCGLLAEFGLGVPQGIGQIAGQVPELIEDATNDLLTQVPASARLPPACWSQL